MTGPEHFREAEENLDCARRASDRGREEDAAFWQREAQVHATLAQAAATALHGHEGQPSEDRSAWFDVASTSVARKRDGAAERAA
jgi:hypothetical protein